MDYEFLNPQGGGEKQSENKAIDNILRTGADFIGNQFQAMFYWFDEYGSIENVFYQHLNPIVRSTLIYNKNNADERRKQGNFVDGDLDYETKYKQAILSKEGFLVRFLNIKMPTVKNETYTIKVGMHTIEKIKTTKAITPQASFSFRLDANLEWLDFFNKASGNFNSISQNTNEFSDWRRNISMVTKCFVPSNVTSNHRLCLFVNNSCFDYTNQMYKFRENYHDIKNTIPFSYVFQDVKFLGPGNITYESNGGGTQEITVDFIYKRLRKIRNLDDGTIEVV